MDDCGRTDILFSYHAERGNYEKKFMNSRSEAEGRAWLAINSLHHNLYKLFLKYLPIITLLPICSAVIMGVSVVFFGFKVELWGVVLFLVNCLSIVILTYISIKVRRKGVDSFFSSETEEPLKYLSVHEKRMYRIFSWLAPGPFFSFLVVFVVTLVAHFNGAIRISPIVWMVFSGWFVLSVYSFYWFVQRTRRMVRKLTTQLAEEHALTPVADS